MKISPLCGEIFQIVPNLANSSFTKKESPPLARKWWGFLSNTSQGDRHGVRFRMGG
jgi:hypothetical protein